MYVNFEDGNTHFHSWYIIVAMTERESVNFIEKLQATNPDDFIPIERYIEFSELLSANNICIYPTPPGIGRIINEDPPREYYFLQIHRRGDINNTTSELTMFITGNKLIIDRGIGNTLAKECMQIVASALGQEITDENTHAYQDPVLTKVTRQQLVLDFPTQP